jgi:ATP-independent RNA helicase DbpA
MNTALPPSAPGTDPAPNLSFDQLPLAPAMLANLRQLGYHAMTPIQAASLPPALAGQDLIAQAKTGSGKTAAFALSLLARLNPRRFAVQAWCCVRRASWPTRWRRKSAAWRAARTTSRY